MIKYIAKRLGISLLVLLLGSLLMFILVINAGDPLANLRESNSPNRDNLIRQRTLLLGLDKPWYERYLNWLGGAAKCLYGQCDLGTASNGQSVNALIASAAGVSIRLVILATCLAIVTGVILGILTAIRQYSGFDYEEQERKIYAKYDDKTIRVYQAYNNVIAGEAIKLGTFGEHFSLTRMTWIKPSFLWMMYRCGWAEKENQERVLAIDIKKKASRAG